MDGRLNAYDVSHRDEEYFYGLFRDFFSKEGAKTEWYNPGKNQGKEADFRVSFDGDERKIELKTNYKYDLPDDLSFVIEYQQRSDIDYKRRYTRNHNEGWRYYCEADEIWFWLKNTDEVIRVDWKKLKRDLDYDDMKKGIVKPEYTPARLGGEGKDRINAASLIPKKDGGKMPWIEFKQWDKFNRVYFIAGRSLTWELIQPYVIGELYIDEGKLTMD